VSKGGRREALTPSELNLMAFDVRDGKASKDDAKLLLQLFCQSIEHGLISARDPVADLLLAHIREAFRAYLNGGRTIEAAFGLTRKMGRPAEADEQMQMQMAAEVLRHRLAGGSHQEALAEAADRFERGVTIVGEAWRRHRVAALVIVRDERDRDRYPWTPEEVERLKQIFGKKV
jgi:hypothetical protein